MDLRDLQPKGDVKGGSPKTPSVGIPVREFESSVSDGNDGHVVVWRTIALIEMAVISTAAVAFFAIGIGNVKFSEIDSIMSTRSPYSPSERLRLQENFDSLKSKQNEFEGRIHYLEMRHDDGKP